MEFLSSTVVFAIAAVTFVVIFVISRDNNKKRKLPPGPKGVEAWSGLYKIMRRGGQAEIAGKWADKYGDIVMVTVPVLGTRFLYLSNPDDARELFAGKATRDIANSRENNIVNDVLLKHVIGFISPENSDWNKMRKLFHWSLKFYGEGYQTMETTIHSELNRLVDELEESEGKDVDAKNIFSKSLLNIIAIVITGKNIEAGSPVRQLILTFFSTLFSILSPTFTLTVRCFPFLLHIPGTASRRLWQTAINAKTRLLQHFFHNVKVPHTPGRVRGLVDVWLQEQKKEEFDWLTDDHVCGLIITILFAGTFTTSTSVASIFLYLLNYPEVARKIQTEVDRVVGPEQKPALEHRSKCHYTEATVLETQRLLSLAPLGFPHKTIADTEFKGYHIPRGTEVHTNQWKFHRSGERWEEALDFRPDRFLDDNGELVSANHPLRQQLLPFGVGKRACPGESFARARMFLYLSTLLQQYDILPPESGQVLTPESWHKLGVTRFTPYKCQFRKRK